MGGKEVDGGPAFPTLWDTTAYTAHMGMSLRDWFAGQERSEPPFMSVKTAAEFIGIEWGEYNSLTHWHLVLAKWRFLMADAMLKARENV